jgi:hypothetical protein
MTYDKYDNVAVVDGFDFWFDELTQQKKEIIDDILPEVLGSGLHEYNGIATDWRFTYTGRGYF